MKTHLTHWLKKWFVILPLVLLIIAAGSYLARGWIRVTVIPAGASLVYEHSVQSVYNKETATLNDPLRSLGFKNIIHAPAKCQLAWAQNIHTSVECVSSSSSYMIIGDTDRAALVNNAKSLSERLQNNAWQGTYSNSGPYTSLLTLATSISSGIDWQPDAAYTKQVGNTSCTIDFNTAFSKPKPAAIAGRVDCWRQVDVFGNPY